MKSKYIHYVISCFSLAHHYLGINVKILNMVWKAGLNPSLRLQRVSCPFLFPLQPDWPFLTSEQFTLLASALRTPAVPSAVSSLLDPHLLGWGLMPRFPFIVVELIMNAGDAKL